MEKTKIIVLEPQKKLRELLQFSLESTFNFHIFFCESIDKAKAILEETPSIQAVISTGNDIDGKNPYELYTFMVDHFTSIPFICTNSSISINWKIQKDKAIHSVRKENIILQLNTTIWDLFHMEETEDVEEFTSITSSPLKNFHAINTDLFIKLRSGRYLKIFTTGDKITDDDISRFQKKGVYEFYLQKTAAKWILKELDAQMPEIINNPDKEIVLGEDNYDEECRQVEVKEEEIVKVDSPFASEQKFLSTVHDKTKKALQKIKINKNFAQLLAALDVDRNADNYILTRIGLVCNISCNIANVLHWGSDATYEKFVYMAYTHDITLYKDIELAKLQDKSDAASLSAQLKDKYLKHPEEAAYLISQDNRAPPDAAQIILQHHERPDRTGFPKSLPSYRLAPFSCVLMLSVHMAQYIIDNPTWNLAAYIEASKQKFRGDVFYKIYAALEHMPLKGH